MAKLRKDTKKVSNSTRAVGAEPEAAFNWFPGHMMKALREVKARVDKVDLVLEIRDARLPLASGNSLLREAVGGKSRLTLLNKANLSDPEVNKAWEEWFTANKEEFLFINCLDRASLKEVIAKAKTIIENKRKQSGGDNIADKDKYKFMIVGLPNTGKSTFINSVANRNAAKVANKPGQTQVQQWINVDDQVDLLDTPGIMPARIEEEVHKTWMSIINAIPDHVVSDDEGACYLVNSFLKRKNPEFKDRYKFDSLDMGLEEALTHIAKVRGCLKHKGLPDLDRVYKLILIDFREGLLGRISLETPPRIHS